MDRMQAGRYIRIYRDQRVCVRGRILCVPDGTLLVDLFVYADLLRNRFPFFISLQGNPRIDSNGAPRRV